MPSKNTEPQPTEKLIPYYRVSTDNQGRSGLGLEAQEEAVNVLAKSKGAIILRSYTEIESGKQNDRPQLAIALADCWRSDATLVIAKLDRLTRNTRFLLGPVESGADVIFCDLPNIPPGPAGKFLLTQMAAVAELEAGLISQRTKAALAAAKARGLLLGSHRPGAHRLQGGAHAKASKRAGAAARANANAVYTGLAERIRRWREQGRSFRAIASQLTDDGHTPRRGRPWNATQVLRVLERVKGAS
jgi:DNA invertase Pin-like site-specific DNA recombinase